MENSSVKSARRKLKLEKSASPENHSFPLQSPPESRHSASVSRVPEPQLIL